MTDIPSAPSDSSLFAPIIGLLGNDSNFLGPLERALTGCGFKVNAYSSPQVFHENYPSARLACVVMDMSRPGTDLSCFHESLPDCFHSPTVLLSGRKDSPDSVMAFKAVAVHFFTRPEIVPKVLSALTLAMAESAEHSRAQELACLRRRFSSLTHREMEILLHVLAGKLNKQIASELGIALQTVKIHRMRITEKSGLVSVAELARAACLLGYQPAA